MNVLQALRADHEVELVTITDPDLRALDEFFDTAAGDVPVRRADGAPRLLSSVAGNRFGTMTAALFNRSVRRLEDEYDLVVSTYNEQYHAGSSVLYMHHPNFDRSALPRPPGQDSAVYAVYDRLCAAVAGTDDADYTDTRVLANSNWTAERVEQSLGVSAEVVYPPVASGPLVDRSLAWHDRDPGFVTIGRITPAKRVLRTIEIVDRVRERGHGVHLHVVGGAYDTDYADQVASLAGDREYVHLEGEVSRDRLVELITGHRYGIHGKDEEHFGMAVAELVAGGALPFVPDGGGQREIVGGCSALLYEDAADAVAAIDRVVEDRALQQRIRDTLPDPTARFGRERFRQEIREVVQTTVSAPQRT